MGEPETVSEAPAEPELAEPVAPAEAPAVWKDRFTLEEILYLYEVGRAAFGKADIQHWRDALSIGINAGGVLVGTRDGDIDLLAVVWPTSNPFDEGRHWPLPDGTGVFAYVAWLFNIGPEENVRHLRDHIAKTFKGARWIAHDEARRGRKTRRVTIPINGHEGNGHG